MPNPLVVHNPETHFGACWQARFAYALDTGVRIAELVGMQPADVDEAYASVGPKGRWLKRIASPGIKRFKHRLRGAR